MTNKRKILYVITKSVWGGAQKYVFDLATRLPRDAHEAMVALGGNGLLAEKLRAAGIRVINIPSLNRDVSIGKDWTTFRSLLKIFRAERPDVAHLNSSKIGLFGAIAARLARIPKIIFTAHGWIFNEDRPLPVKLFYALLSWLTGLFATDIIVLSEYEYEQTKKMPFIIGKTSLIRNGIGEFETLPRAESRKFLSQKIGRPKNFLDDKLIIGTISELHPNKGLEYAIRAISVIVASEARQSSSPPSLRGTPKQSYNSVFIIIGGGQDEIKLRALIKKLNLENNIFLTGFINDAQRLLPAFDIFTMTSLKEGLPYVILEAGLLGLPVVVSSVGAMPEILNDHHCEAKSGRPRQSYHNELGMLVTPKDIRGIAAALQKLADNPRLRGEIGSRLKQKIAADFTYAAMLDGTKRLYENCYY